MSNNKFLTIISTLFIIICFSINTYAITEKQYLIINDLIEQENIDKAFEDLKIFQKGTGKLSARNQILIGKIYLALEQPAKAFTFFEKAIFTSTSTDDRAYAGMSLSSLKLGNLTDAQKYAEKALERNRDLVQAKLALGQVYLDFGQIEKSEKYFKQAILASPNSQVSARVYASSKMRQGKLNKAKKIILTALLNQKPDAATIDLLGKIFWVEGNIKEAINLRKQASQMFIKSGNIKRSDQIKVWLNMTNIPKVNSKNSNINKNKLIKTPKLNKQSKIIQPQVKLDKRAIIKPNSKPEEIFLNKNKPVSTGSGVIINNGKWIITNKHVISGSSYIVVRNGVGKVREVESVKIPESKDKDMAILILKKPFPSNHSLSINDIRDPIPGEKVYLMGYPMSSVLGRYNPSISEGIVSKASGFGELAGEFQITAKMNKGNSGGPIFNNNGQIIGIAVGKLNKKEVLNKDGFIPEDVNIGISGNVISNFLKSPLKDNFNDNKKYEATEIYKYMRPSVVFVVSQ